MYSPRDTTDSETLDPRTILLVATLNPSQNSDISLIKNNISIAEEM